MVYITVYECTYIIILWMIIWWVATCNRSLRCEEVLNLNSPFYLQRSQFFCLVIKTCCYIFKGFFSTNIHTHWLNTLPFFWSPTSFIVLFWLPLVVFRPSQRTARVTEMLRRRGVFFFFNVRSMFSKIGKGMCPQKHWVVFYTGITCIDKRGL